MKLKKIQKSGGKIVWKREVRPSLTSEEEEKIGSLTASQAKSLPTEEKRVWFYNEIQKIRQSCEDAKTMIVIDREHFFRDSCFISVFSLLLCNFSMFIQKHK